MINLSATTQLLILGGLLLAAVIYAFAWIFHGLMSFGDEIPRFGDE